LRKRARQLHCAQRGGSYGSASIGEVRIWGTLIPRTENEKTNPIPPQPRGRPAVRPAHL